MVRRKLGQHFLINLAVAQREIDYAQISSKDTVLEIGPGKGFLTKLLALKAKQIIAVEIDPELIDQLKQWVPKNVTLVLGDVMKIDFHQFPVFNKVVANLPFSISSPITFKLLEYPFSKAVLIYQKDFAERMAALPGSKEYSRLSVNVYYKTHCKILEMIPRTYFYPKPRVDASIVELVPRRKPPFIISDEKLFFQLTRELFNHRRKKIKNTLEKIYTLPDSLPYKEQRVEELTPEQIGEICTTLSDSLSKK